MAAVIALVFVACPVALASLYPVKADAILEQQGGVYEARRALEDGASGTSDIAALSRLATAQDAYGDRAPEAYARLANALAKASPERLRALERGFNVSLRDGNQKRAAEFASLLQAEGHPEYGPLLGGNSTVQNDIVIPGGIYALSVVARLGHHVSADRIIEEYARQVAGNVCTNGCIRDEFTGRIQKYFATISQLESMGTRDTSGVSITLSLNGKSERTRTEDVLRLLGLRMQIARGQVKIDHGENQDQAKKQEILSALQIDEIGLQDELQGGKPFQFTIQNEPAAIYPSAKLWRESFPRVDQSQFLLMLLNAPLMARLYVGISTLDRPTLAALLGNGGLFWFSGYPADLLSLYGSSFALQGKRASVPGGFPAEPVWTEVVGANPDHPGAFYHALMQQPNATLLAYFYELSNLDQKHQVFFTANAVRFKRFYTMFANLPKSKSPGILHDSSLTNLLRSVPLDDGGHVAFPGSPELWTVAKGHTTDNKKVAKMLQKVSRTATPDVEDEILLRLLETRDKTGYAKTTEFDNFLAVSNIDAHRRKPLDEESALMLAQHYSEFSPVYAYFTDLHEITLAGFGSFFNLIDHIRQQPLLEQNLELGQVYSLVDWVVLMERHHTIDDDEAARLFSLICDRFVAAADEGARTMASLDLAGAILAACGHGTSGKWDDALRMCLLGEPTDGWRAKDYEVVLDEQKAPRLDILRPIFDAVQGALSPSAPRVTEIVNQTGMLASVPIPKDARVTGKEKEAILLYDPTKVQKLVDEWNQKGAKSPLNLKNAQKIAGELIKAMEPQVTAALAAPIYAYFLRSTDLVVSEDPLLLRKHQYLDFTPLDEGRHLIRESSFVPSSDGLGSHMEGGFAEFGLAAGFAAAAGWKQGGAGGSAVVAEQIAAIRSATWDRLLESDQRLATLRILVAREWIVDASQDPSEFLTLSEYTSGLLSLSRRSQLLNAIEERDWQQVWTSITLPDLFRLGRDYLQSHPSGPATSAAAAQLRTLAAANDGRRLDILGNIPNHVLGCSHTHIVSDAPYEEYEHRLKATDMAERTAEFKLFLAYRADSLGIQPADLARVAEKLAAKAFRVSQMNDYHDWRSLLTAYASVTNDDLTNALEP